MSGRRASGSGLPSVSVWDELTLWSQNGSLGRPIAQVLRALLESDRACREELIGLQAQKLERLITCARERSRYYGSLLDSQLTKTVGGDARVALEHLPILSKYTVRTEAPNIRTDYRGKRYTSRTGGTTGDPLEIVKNPGAVAWGLAALGRGRLYGDVRVSSRGIFIKGFRPPSRKGRVKARLGRRLLLPAFSGTDASRAARIEQAIHSGTWEFLEGYVSDVLSVVEQCRVQGNRLRGIFVTGEMLYDVQYEALRASFETPVYSYYGSNEVAGLAFQCEHGSYHVCDEHVILEVVNEAGMPVWEQRGRIVVTDLDNFAMPLIRYDIGDEGVLTNEPCPCGRAHTRLARLLGRAQDYVCNPDGHKLPATFFAGRFRGLRRIGRVQLKQETPSEIKVEFEGSGPPAVDEARELCDEIRTRLGPEVIVAAQQVPSVYTTPRGKVPLIRNLIHG